MIQVAQRFAGEKKVWYTGIDLFEARPEGQPAISLKEAYRVLRATEAGIRLVPGTPARSLSSAANAHPNTDLILIGPDVSRRRSSRCVVLRAAHAARRTRSILIELHGRTAKCRLTASRRTQIAEWAARESISAGRLNRARD